MLALGNDHGGYDLKNDLIRRFESKNIKYFDFGCYSKDSTDYPIYARKVCEGIVSGQYIMGILICCRGNGMMIAANRFKDIRAALCHDTLTAALAREHNNANVLVMGAHVIASAAACEIAETFITTNFSFDERHVRRLNIIDGFK